MDSDLCLIEIGSTALMQEEYVQQVLDETKALVDEGSNQREELLCL